MWRYNERIKIQVAPNIAFFSIAAGEFPIKVKILNHQTILGRRKKQTIKQQKKKQPWVNGGRPDGWIYAGLCCAAAVNPYIYCLCCRTGENKAEESVCVCLSQKVSLLEAGSSTQPSHFTQTAVVFRVSLAFFFFLLLPPRQTTTGRCNLLCVPLRQKKWEKKSNACML